MLCIWMWCECPKPLSVGGASSPGTVVLDLPSLVSATGVRREHHTDPEAFRVNASGRHRATEGSVLLARCWNLARVGNIHLKDGPLKCLTGLCPGKLRSAETGRVNHPRRTALWQTASASMRANTLLVCLRHVTNLQHVVRTRHVRVSLHVERLQEGQSYPVAFRKADGVVALAHGWVWAWVVWAGQNPRGRGQHLVAARNCTDTDDVAYLKRSFKKTPDWRDNTKVHCRRFPGNINNVIDWGLPGQKCSCYWKKQKIKWVLQRGWILSFI